MPSSAVKNNVPATLTRSDGSLGNVLRLGAAAVETPRPVIERAATTAAATGLPTILRARRRNTLAPRTFRRRASRGPGAADGSWAHHPDRLAERDPRRSSILVERGRRSGHSPTAASRCDRRRYPSVLAANVHSVTHPTVSPAAAGTSSSPSAPNGPALASRPPPPSTVKGSVRVATTSRMSLRERRRASAAGPSGTPLRRDPSGHPSVRSRAPRSSARTVLPTGVPALPTGCDPWGAPAGCLPPLGNRRGLPVLVRAAGRERPRSSSLRTVLVSPGSTPGAVPGCWRSASAVSGL